MNPFEQYNVAALSPSSVSMWMEDRGKWVARYAYGLREKANANMALGNVVETAMSLCLDCSTRPVLPTTLARNVDLAIIKEMRIPPDRMHNWREYLIQDQGEEAALDFESRARGMSEQACHWVNQTNTPAALLSQRKVSIFPRDRGLEIPIIGYMDFCWDNWFIDLKTTKAMPSAPRASHELQVSFYAKALGMPSATLLYVTPKKFRAFEIGANAIEAHYDTFITNALGLQATLRAFQTRDELAQACPPNLGHQYLWKDDAYRQEALETIEPWRKLAA